MAMAARAAHIKKETKVHPHSATLTLSLSHTHILFVQLERVGTRKRKKEQKGEKGEEREIGDGEESDTGDDVTAVTPVSHSVTACSSDTDSLSVSLSIRSW